MTTWQADLLDELRGAIGSDAVRPYGSVVDGGLDAWSDLDVVLELDGDVRIADLVDGTPWAWQEHRDVQDETVRLVFADGRRLDLRARGGHVLLPEAPADVAVRFDAALALTRIGRGAKLIGLHLLLGIVRGALVDGMLLADRATGTDHHRVGTEHDAFADEVAALLAGPLDTSMPLAVCELVGRVRRRLEPVYLPDWTGLVAVARLADAPT